MSQLVRVVSELSQLKGALILLAGGAYFHSDDWVLPLQDLLGKTMHFKDVVARLREALTHSHNPKFHEVSAEEWARRITLRVSE